MQRAPKSLKSVKDILNDEGSIQNDILSIKRNHEDNYTYIVAKSIIKDMQKHKN